MHAPHRQLPRFSEMIYWRLLRTICHLCVGLLTCAVIFPWIGAAGRTLHVQRWSLRLLKICRVRVEVINPHGAGSAVRALIVANHVSWLDIFVINAFEPCRFVAKADIRDWPLIGWLCAKTGTIFIARGRLRDVRRIYQQLVASLAAGERIAVFPEGTTAAQGELLPFHANLLLSLIHI